MSKLFQKPPTNSLNRSSDSRPALPFQADSLKKAMTYQAWVILSVLAIGIIFDYIQSMQLGQQAQFMVSKNLLAGSVLTWVGQWTFTKVSLGLSGYHQRKKIVHRFYLAHGVKWVITLIGFAIIFRFLRPLQALWVFMGFILLQLSYMVLMYRHKPKI